MEGFCEKRSVRDDVDISFVLAFDHNLQYIVKTVDYLLKCYIYK